MENKDAVKFYNKTWFMWITLIFFAPVGIFLMWKNKRYHKVVRVVLSGFFGLIFGILVFAPRVEQQKAKEQFASTQDFAKSCKKEKEDKNIKSTDLAKIKSVKRIGDKLIVESIDTTKGDDKKTQFLGFEMAVKDIIDQVKSGKEQYKTLEIKNYKNDNDTELFSMIFTKEKIDAIKDDTSFIQVKYSADKVNGYDITKDKPTEKEKEENFLNSMSTFSNVMSTELKCFTGAIKRQSLKTMKIHADNIVYYCNNIKKNNAPDRYKNAKAKLDKACTIYISIYSNVMNNIDNDEWLSNATIKSKEADKLIKEVIKEIVDKSKN